MSKNIIIQVGGVGRQLTADKLETALVGGGSCLWIPEDEITLIDKTITEDGTYRAREDGATGYKTVTVRGIGKATGKAPDGSGDIAQATVDPTTGEIEIKKIPSAIKITTQPTRIEYNCGDLIDFDGMVVKAYLQSGGVFMDDRYPDGIIPDAELNKPVKEAHADGDSSGEHDTPEGIYYISDGGLVRCNTQITTSAYPNEVNYARIPAGVRYAAFYNGSGDYYIVAMSRESFGTAEELHTWTGQAEPVVEATLHDIQLTIDGELYYYVSMYWYSPAPVPTGDIEHNAWTGSILQAAIEIMYGTSENTQSIPVNWISPYDGKTMTDSFTITVNPAPEPEPDPEPNDGDDPVAGGETP